GADILLALSFRIMKIVFGPSSSSRIHSYSFVNGFQSAFSGFSIGLLENAAQHAEDDCTVRITFLSLLFVKREPPSTVKEPSGGFVSRIVEADTVSETLPASSLNRA